MPSSNAINAMTAPETDAVFITLLTLFIDDEKVLSICDDKQTVTSYEEEFIPWGFKALLPSQTADVPSSCRLQIDNTDLSIARIIKANINHKITVEVKVILFDTPNTVEQGPFNFILRNIKINAKTITGELFDNYIADKKFSCMTYNPTDFPGLFF